MVNQDSTGVSIPVIAVIPAAGLGTRLGSAKAKQFMDLCGKPMLAVTLEHFQKCDLVDRIVVVVPESDVEYCRYEIVERYSLSKIVKVIVGGQMRQDSVRKGIEAIENSCRWIVIHDGVRPLVTEGLIAKVINAAKEFRAVITGLPVKDTVKEVDERGRVAKSLDRRHVWTIQTPQIFRYEDIHLAHQNALKHGWVGATDDAHLVEKLGIPIEVIEGEETNIKVTTPKDLEFARLLISTQTL
jgi:2-C-methyl-D-erythritol 4-phosphate cytidylyltransferase